MSLRYEQYRSLKMTQDFLKLMFTKECPKTKKELRAHAYRCLRHFPCLTETGEPMFSQDTITIDNTKMRDGGAGPQKQK